MAEYYAVLKKAIGGLDGSAADGRRTVYDKARNALIGQLKAVDPPLTTAEISRQRLELEEAIRKVEREAASGVPLTARPANPAPAMPRIDAAPAQADAPAEGPTPQDVFRRAIQDAEHRGSAAGAIERAPPPQYRAETGGATADIRPPRDRIERAPPSQLPPREEPPPRRAEPEYRPQQDYRQPADYRSAPDYDAPQQAAEPRLAPDYGQDWEREPPQSAPSQSQPAPFVDSRDRPAAFTGKRRRGYAEDDDREIYAKAARPSRLPGILLFVLIVAVVGGLGALAWSQRAVLLDLLASFDSPSSTPATPTPPTPLADANGKDPARLADGRPARVVDPDAPAVDGAATDAVTPPTAMTDAPATGDALVAQKAILYEEPVDAAVASGGITAINAAVTWRFIESGANGPEVEASLQVPERNMKVRVSFHKNIDQDLPASHLIEVVVDTPADFPGKGISSVPRIVFKPTEDAKGQPLVGADAKITDGFFWIALSAADQDVESNLALIRERNWIDLPFAYETGQRAILTFEKGLPGERVFEKAMAAWAGAG